MSLLEQLGLTFPSSFQHSQETALQQHYTQHFGYLQQQGIISRCIHLNCLICAEETKKAQELKIKQDKIIAEKKLVYENRCKDYMKKFRRESKWITAHQPTKLTKSPLPKKNTQRRLTTYR